MRHGEGMVGYKIWRGGEIVSADSLFGEEESACSECHKLFQVKTGEFVKGWERVHIVSPGPLICKACKETIIDALQKAVV